MPFPSVHHPLRLSHWSQSPDFCLYQPGSTCSTCFWPDHQCCIILHLSPEAKSFLESEKVTQPKTRIRTDFSVHVNKTTEMLELTVQISHPVLPQLLFPVLRNTSQLQPRVIVQRTCGQRFCVTCSNCIKHCVMQECVSIISCCGSYYNKCISPGAPASERCDCLRHVADRRQHAVTREHISWLYCLIVFSQVCVKIIIITNTN